jgi:class 3 adenylate cyclase
VNPVTELLKKNRSQAIDELTSSVVETVPRYSMADAADVRHSCETLFDDFLNLVETGDGTPLTQRLALIAEERLKQGFSAAEFLRALLLVYPVVRNTVRRAGQRNDPNLARMFEDVELAVFRIASIASNLFASGMTRAADERATALQRDLDKLALHEQALTETTREAQRALKSAEDFNARVISSLSTGVLVVEAPSLTVRLWSARMEQISGIAPADAVGRFGPEVVGKLKGLPTEEIISTVRATGRMPMTKVLVELPNGRKRHLFIRGERLRNAEGQGDGVVILVDDTTERELLIDSFSRHVSKEVVQRVLSRAEPSRLEGERKHCTVLFADVRGFTGIAERITPEALHEMLNAYFRVMIEHVAAQGGIIDKFIGDKVMAVFASSGQEGESALAASGAALAILGQVASLNTARRASGHEPLEVGIGLNTGMGMMGNIGSEERMSYTVIGDMVNVADRLQSLAGPGEVYLGARTRELIEAKFEVEEIGQRTLKGRVASEHLFKLLGPK